MRQSKRLARFLPRLHRMAAEMADCAVTVAQEPGYERPETIFTLERPLWWEKQDELCTRIQGVLVDWCVENWVEPTFIVVGPRIVPSRRLVRPSARPRRRAKRPTRAR